MIHMTRYTEIALSLFFLIYFLHSRRCRFQVLVNLLVQSYIFWVCIYNCWYLPYPDSKWSNVSSWWDEPSFEEPTWGASPQRSVCVICIVISPDSIYSFIDEMQMEFYSVPFALTMIPLQIQDREWPLRTLQTMHGSLEKKAPYISMSVGASITACVGNSLLLVQQMCLLSNTNGNVLLLVWVHLCIAMGRIST